MSAKHVRRAEFAGAVLLGACPGRARPTHGHPASSAYGQPASRSFDRTDALWQASAPEDPDRIRAF